MAVSYDVGSGGWNCLGKKKLMSWCGCQLEVLRPMNTTPTASPSHRPLSSSPLLPPILYPHLLPLYSFRLVSKKTPLTKLGAVLSRKPLVIKSSFFAVAL